MHGFQFSKKVNKLHVNFLSDQFFFTVFTLLKDTKYVFFFNFTFLCIKALFTNIFATFYTICNKKLINHFHIRYKFQWLIHFCPNPLKVLISQLNKGPNCPKVPITQRFQLPKGPNCQIGQKIDNKNPLQYIGVTSGDTDFEQKP